MVWGGRNALVGPNEVREAFTRGSAGGGAVAGPEQSVGAPALLTQATSVYTPIAERAIGFVSEESEVMSTTDANTYASGSFTPNAGGFLLACVTVSGSVLTTPAHTDSRGGGWTWTFVGGGTQSTFAYAAWALVAPAATAGTFTADYTADAGTGAGIWIGEFSVEAASVLQFKTGSSGSAGVPAWTFDAPTLFDSAVVAFLYTGTTPPGLTPPTNYTQPVDNGWASPTSGMSVVYHPGPGALSTVTYGSSTATSWRGMALEIGHT